MTLFASLWNQWNSSSYFCFDQAGKPCYPLLQGSPPSIYLSLCADLLGRPKHSTATGGGEGAWTTCISGCWAQDLGMAGLVPSQGCEGGSAPGLSPWHQCPSSPVFSYRSSVSKFPLFIRTPVVLSKSPSRFKLIISPKTPSPNKVTFWDGLIHMSLQNINLKS